MTLAEIRAFVLSLPDVTEEPHFHRTSFRVRGKIIATADPAEPFLNVMVGEDIREPLLAARTTGIEKLPWGRKIVGLRVDLDRARADVVQTLLREARRRRVPGS